MPTRSRSALRSGRADLLFYLFASAIGCILAVFIVLATADGPHLSHDSIAYIAAVRSLLEGHGLVVPFGYAHPTPLTHWPPLYPLMLAFFAAISGTVTGAARWLSVVLFVVNTVMVGSLASKYAGSDAAGYAAACLFASSLEVWRLHCMLMAEPLFLLLILLFVYFLDEYLVTGKSAPLLVSAMFVGLSVVTRYAGLAFIAGGAIIIFAMRRNPTRARIEATLWTLVAAAPMALLVVWNLFRAHTATDRTLTWHPPSSSFWMEFMPGLVDPFVPELWPQRIWVTAAVWLPLVPFCVLYPWRSSGMRTQYLAALIALNAAFLIGVVFFADAALDVRRALAPVSILAILLAASAGARFLRRPVIAAAVCAVIVVPHLFVLFAWFEIATHHGMGLVGRGMQRSETIAFIRQLPPETVIYTNLPEPVYMLTGRNARFAPVRANATTGAPLPAGETELQFAEIRQQVRLNNAVAVYFLDDAIRLPWMYAAPALAARGEFTRVIESKDATICLPGFGFAAK